ncbi:MAG: hypothetical protein QM820_59685 [Minicystis sp.]
MRGSAIGRALVLVLAASCASGSSVNTGGGGAGGSGGAGGEQEGPCTGGKVRCDGHCVDLDTDASNCGACGRTCVLVHGTAACVAGECGLAACETGWADCDGDLATGCELAIACDEGQSCTTSCSTEGTLSCANPCTPSCAPPAEICNAADDNCDGVCDEGAIAGCRIGVHRANSPTKGHFYTTDAGEAMSGDYHVESLNYFYLYTSAVADLRPFFQCPAAGGKHFFTTSTDCEGTAAPEKTVGFIAPVERCGSTPLYRLLNPPAGAHFYTTSTPERDNAVVNLGFVDEGVAGHVWAGP